MVFDLGPQRVSVMRMTLRKGTVKWYLFVLWGCRGFFWG
uniref:Uncharacterized protein n=1 Tax=Talaromyces marneffei PM1 TaxID=1077442 RepID=A0A093VE68_TALMA